MKEIKHLGEHMATSRGFPMVSIKDSYGVECSLAASRLAKYQQPGTSAVWLGIDGVEAQVLHSDASKVGLNTDATCGWVPYPIPKEVMVTTRMHLERDKVKALVECLQAWLDSETGKFQ